MHCRDLFVFCLISLLLPVSCQDSEWDTEWEESTKQTGENEVKAQKFSLLGTKYRKLAGKAKQDSIIQLKSPSEFKDLISSPRNYSLILLITSDYNCENCQQAFLSVRSVSRSYISSEEELELFFIESRYENTPEIFKKACGRSLDVPALFYLPWPGQLKDLKRMDAMDGIHDLTPINIIYWIQDVTGSIIPDTSAKNDQTGNNNGTILFICLMLISFFNHHERLLKFYKTHTDEDLRQTAAIVVITLVLFCTSGQMFNYIENTAFSFVTEAGQWYWLVPSMRSQLGLESYIIFALTASNVLGLILVLENGPKLNIPANCSRATYGIFVFSLSFIMILFIGRMKM